MNVCHLQTLLSPASHRTQAVFTLHVQVRYLKIIEKSGYQALPWVRYITQNGDYQLRTQWWTENQLSCPVVVANHSDRFFAMLLSPSYPQVQWKHCVVNIYDGFVNIYMYTFYKWWCFHEQVVTQQAAICLSRQLNCWWLILFQQWLYIKVTFWNVNPLSFPLCVHCMLTPLSLPLSIQCPRT